MTAPDYMAEVVKLLGVHKARGFSHADECACGWAIPDTNGWPNHVAHRTHQAEVLAAAGLLPTIVEWGVRHSQGIRRESTERGATEALGPMTSAFERNFRNKTRPTVVSRAVTDWKDATDD